MKTRKFGAAFTAAAIGASLFGAAPANAATPTLGTGVTQEVLFNDPTKPYSKFPTHPNNDQVIARKLDKLIEESPSGSVIRLSTWRWTLASTTNRAKAAADRGVDIRIALNSASMEFAESKRLKDLLGSRVTLCGRGLGNGACTSTRSGGTQHAKFGTFSETGGKKNVVYNTASNIDWGQINGSFNDMLITYGDADCYRKVTNALNDAVTQRQRGTNYRASADGHFDCPASLQRWWIGPEADSYGGMNEQGSTDTLAKNMTVVGGTNCKVRILQSKMDDKRTPVIRRYTGADSKGCFVSGLTRMDAARADDAIARFKSAGIPWRTHVPSETDPGWTRHVHSKVTVIIDPAGTSRVYSGSEHPAKNDHRRNDEVVVETRTPAVINTYDSWARHLYTRTGVPTG